jgi:hypothetical protein
MQEASTLSQQACNKDAIPATNTLDANKANDLQSTEGAYSLSG